MLQLDLRFVQLSKLLRSVPAVIRFSAHSEMSLNLARYCV